MFRPLTYSDRNTAPARKSAPSANRGCFIENKFRADQAGVEMPMRIVVQSVGHFYESIIL